MFQNFVDKLESVPAIIFAGACLVLSFFEKISLWPLNPVWICIFICGLPILCEAVWDLINNYGIEKISSPLLISIAMIASICIGDLFAAGEVAFIMALGELLEKFTVERAKKGLKNLISLAPTQARKVLDNTTQLINASDIKLNDILRILPGEKIPADGIVTEGQAAVNQAVITGESLPVDKNIGDKVFCGTLNNSGMIEIKALGIGKDSSLQKLIQMVEDAGEKKAHLQRVADKWAGVLVPVALLIALAGYFMTGKNLTRAVTVLVVFCPCALVLATPTAVIAAIGQATKNGVVIKSGSALEVMNKINIAAFDKTGTISTGKLQVSNVLTANNVDLHNLILLAASVERYSEHPLARAVLEFANDKGIEPLKSENFAMRAGQGISAEISGEQILCGSENYFDAENILIPNEIKGVLQDLKAQGKALMLIAKNRICLGVIALSDVLRPNVRECMNKLKNSGINTFLISGDNRGTAKYFADMAGISHVEAELLPEDKVNVIKKLQAEGNIISMTGDGVNDAPVLKTADAGIAMGVAGSDITADAADIILMNDDIMKIPYLIALARATVKTIKLGIFLSLFINFVAIILSLKGYLNPTTGALVHNAGSFLVIFIAAMLYDKKIYA